MIRTGTLATMAAAMLLTGSALYAQSSSSAGSSKQLIVTSASVDRVNDTVSFKGSGFGTKKPSVFCELTQMTVLTGNDEELLVAFPASALDGTFLFTVARGNSSNERAAFYVTTSRPQVVEGKEGPMGPQGPSGPAGPQGANGDKGDKGDAGAQGAQGLKGDKGDVGAQGPRGETGATGAAGPQGAEGPQGAQGAPGPQGPAGPQGAAGPAGPQGVQGVMGPLGPAGPQGVAGANGVSGVEKLIGDTGALQLGAAISSSIVVACPAGKRPVGGGHELVSISSQQLNVTSSAPYDNNGVVGWRVAFRNGTTNSMANVQVKAYVICAIAQ